MQLEICPNGTSKNDPHRTHKSDSKGYGMCERCGVRFRPIVNCDDGCLAFVFPVTKAELKASFLHYKDHNFMRGCSHGS